MIYKYLFFIVLFNYNLTVSAQIGYGTNSPDNTAVVEMFSDNKGLLIPRVSLTSLIDKITVPSPTNALIIYNTTTNGIGINLITPGFYYFNTTQDRWIWLGEVTPAWNLMGNSDTVAGINFIGTSNYRDLNFKRNNLHAGTLNIEYHQSTSFGVSALNIANTDPGNVAIGVESLSKNTEGGYNVAYGVEALKNNTTADQNIAMGYQSLYNNLTQPFNIALGTEALKNNSGGEANLAQGYQSLLNNTNGNKNIALGTEALKNNTVDANIAIGHQSLINNIDAGLNIAIGHQSLAAHQNTEGNIAIGYSALTNNINGYRNSSIGNLTFKMNTVGSSNTGIGHQSFYNNVSGDINTGMGYKAGLNSNATRNIALGANTNLPTSTGNEELNIANYIFGQKLSGNVGTLSPAVKIGIGIIFPSSTLHVSGSMAANINIVNSGIVTENEYTVLVEGNISIPAPTIANSGRMYYLTNNNGGNYTINISPAGSFRENGNNTSIYNLNNTDGNKGVLVQSTGTVWVILAKY